MVAALEILKNAIEDLLVLFNVYPFNIMFILMVFGVSVYIVSLLFSGLFNGGKSKNEKR